MKLDFLIAGNATPAFLSQIAFFKVCLNNLGGAYADARLLAVLGDHEVAALPTRWKQYFEAIEVEWAHEPGANNPLHRAQHDRRFELFRPDADMVFICDADIAIIRGLDDLLADLKNRPALAGVIAHYPFDLPGEVEIPVKDRPSNADWSWIAQTVLGKPIALPYKYTLFPPDLPQRAPFYINYGVFIGPPDLMTAFYARDKEIRDQVAKLLGEWWAPQVSLALAVEDLGLPNLALPMRYNFPNDPIAERMYPNEQKNMIFLHYLRKNRIDRHKIFSSEVEFDAFMDKDLIKTNKDFQRFVREITKGIYPFG
jgi:hypothetical protein